MQSTSSTTTLKECVNDVAGSAEVAARLAEISTEVRANGGVDKAADTVERFLR